MTGLIVVRIFTVRAICPNTVTGEPLIYFDLKYQEHVGRVVPAHQDGFDGAASFSDALLVGSYNESLCPDLAGLFYLPDTYQLK